MPNQQTKKRVTLQVSSSLHKRIKELSREREETMMELMLTALQKFITTEPTQGSRIGLLQK
jgi:predicted transcriptional regulator